jgi:uncharacterized membrane protein YgcG
LLAAAIAAPPAAAGTPAATPAPASGGNPSDVAGNNASAPAAAPALPIPPANQLGQAVAALHIKPDGSSQMTIRLDPAELGQVQVQIGRASSGAATIEVAVERLDTLRALQADLTHLHLALDRAGVSDQRSLTLHLSPPTPAAANAGTDNSGFSSNFSQGGSAQGGGFSQSGGSGQGGRQPYTAPIPSAAPAGDGLAAVFTLGNAAPASARSSINITA